MSDNFLKVYNGLALKPRDNDPANPIDGDVQFSDGTHRPKGLWVYYDGNWRQAGGGSGEGFNYFTDTNADGEAGTGEWIVYSNTTAGNTIGTVPAPDDFGGTPSGNLTWTSNTTDPLIGDADFKLSKTASNVQGEGIYYEFSNEKAHRGLKLLFRVFSDLSGLDDNDISIWLVSSSDGFTTIDNIISANDPEVVVSKITSKQFQLDGDADKSYRLCIHYGSNDTTAKDAYFDGFFFGPKDVTVGQVVSDWKSYTPTTTGFGTLSGVNVIYRRVGSSLEVQGQFIPSSTSGVIAEIGLPPGLSTWSGYTSTNAVGTFYRARATSNNGGVVIASANDSFVNISSSTVFSTGNVNPVDEENASTVSSGDRFVFSFSVRIEGWQSNQVSSSDFGGRDIFVDAAGNGATSLTANVTDIDFTEVEDNSSAWDGSGFTAPDTGFYDVEGEIFFSGSGNLASIDSYIDGSVYRRVFSQQGSETGKKFSIKVRLNKGQRLSFRSNVSDTLQNSTQNHWIFIKKDSSSQQILGTETVAFRATSDSGQTVNTNDPVIYEDVDFDSHGAYNPSTGEYTIPYSGKYLVHACTRYTSTSGSSLTLQVNGSEERTDTTSNGEADPHQLSDVLDLVKGDVVRVVNPSASRTLQTQTARNVFSIARIK